MKASGPARFGDTELPGAQESALRRARRLEWISLAYLSSGVAVVFAVMGSSQAMKVAWIEDMLALVPPLAFLVGARQARRRPSVGYPYGHHRSVAAGHLTAAVALFAMGAFLVYDSGSGLLTGDRPPLGTMNLFGHTVWAGWPMVAAMVYTGIGPVILGHLKQPLSEELHDKVLRADAEMNKADWMTAVAAIVGVLGIGFGLWWADAAAALLIAASVVHDGVREVGTAVRGLLDAEAHTYDDKRVHPVVGKVLAAAGAPDWVERAGCRVRDLGHVFHTEVFVVPSRAVTAAECDGLAEAVRDLDWKLDDVVVVPVGELPDAVRTKADDDAG